jgi:hypothetical protein
MCKITQKYWYGREAFDGVVLEENEKEVVLKTNQGVVVSIPKSRISSRSKEKESGRTREEILT